MALHVGHALNAHGRMRMGRRTADNPDQLERARMALGLPASADRDAGEPGEDLGVSESRLLIAMQQLGAAPVSSRQLVKIIPSRRQEAQMTREGHVPYPESPEPVRHDMTDRRGRHVRIHLTPAHELRITVGGQHFRTENPQRPLSRVRAGEREPPSHAMIGHIVLQPDEARALSVRSR